MNRIEFDYYSNTSEIFDFLKDQDWSVFLCSNFDVFDTEKYDIISCCPIKKIIAYQNATIVEFNGSKKVFRDDPMDVLKDTMKESFSNNYTDLPFSGGAIGYFSYDLGNKYESIKSVSADSDNTPIMAFGIYDWSIIIDHKLKKSILIYEAENDLIKDIINNFKNKKFALKKKRTFSINSKYSSNLSYEEYVEKFNSIKSYIEKGDCYQINFAQRFSLSYEGDTWEIFKKVLQKYKAPYSSYMNFPFVKILSYSPERFLQIENNHVETKPIKGTRPIHENKQKDMQLKQELIDSNKDKAENLMIVDLLRNDLGRNCNFGSIRVKKLFEIETFSNVHHLVSTIEGKISDKSNIFKLIRDCFPGGSITGAPKIRSMQIINELESNRRSIYCGSIGYISFNNKVDLNIAIRTIIANKNYLYFWGGGGIVYDSNVKSEFQETIDKVSPIINALKSDNT
ncbi:MAG: aminodeoxychorismate synthase component I [Pseudomonadota bacterium]|nr:aminodeoxychorismate synthase component I [Pseudomonadota bacterium]